MTGSSNTSKMAHFKITKGILPERGDSKKQTNIWVQKKQNNFGVRYNEKHKRNAEWINNMKKSIRRKMK